MPSYCCKQHVIALLLAFSLTGASASSLRERFERTPAKPVSVGSHELKLHFQDEVRNYLLHIPHAHDPALPAPLVMAFHGGGGHAAHMADDERYGLIAKAEREGFIVVFPNGYSKFPRGRLATWNAGECCGDARDRNSDDVGFVRALVDKVGAQVRIDRQQIFATGMSNGGMMAYRLACEAADLFRAVASVAGTEALADCRPARAIPVLHIHARNDTHVLFNGGAGADALRDSAKVMNFVSVPETVARWVKRNRCDSDPRRVLDKPGAYCDEYSGCQENATVRLCVTEAGGHSWPGAHTTRRGKEGASQALLANDVIWDFFKASAAR